LTKLKHKKVVLAKWKSDQVTQKEYRDTTQITL